MTAELLAGTGLAPSGWVQRFLPLVPAGGPVLDLACGSGRHTRLAADAGHPVLALDRDPGIVMAFASRPNVEPMVVDLEDGSPWPLAGRRFAGVIVTNYLHRPILAALGAAVAEDGVLIYETFARGQERFGRPACAEFLLTANELLVAALTAGLTVVAFEDGEIQDTGHPRMVQRIAAVGLRHRTVTERQ